MDATVAGSHGRPALRFLCPKMSLLSPPSHSLLRWLVGAPRVLPPFTVAAVLRLTHGDHAAPDLTREAEEIRGLLPRGFDIIGALLVGGGGSDADVTRALEQARALRELIGAAASHGLVGGHMDTATGEIRFVLSESGGTYLVEGSVVTWEDEPGRFLWEKGCLLRCELPLKLPLYFRPDVNSGIEEQFSSLIESTVAKLRNPHISYLVEGPITSSESRRSIILRGDDLSFDSHTHGNSRTNNCTTSTVSCSEFFTEKRYNLSLTRENADAIAITVNQSASSLKPGTTPVVEYFPGNYVTRVKFFFSNLTFSP